MKKDTKEQIQEHLDIWVHCVMSFVGGFLGAYALFNRFEIFGSAQTANMIHLVMDLEDGDFYQVMLRIGAVLLFAAAVGLAALIPVRTSWNLRRLCIFLEMAVCIGLNFIPKTVDNLIGLYPVFFIMAFQWGAFSGAKGYTSSTIFSTNNLKQMVSAFCLYASSREQKHKEKGVVFGVTLLSYHIGVAVSYAASRMLGMGLQSAWICVLPLLLALVLEAWRE